MYDIRIICHLRVIGNGAHSTAPLTLHMHLHVHIFMYAYVQVFATYGYRYLQRIFIYLLHDDFDNGFQANAYVF